MKNQYTVSKKRIQTWARELHFRGAWAALLCFWSALTVISAGITVWLAVTDKETSATALFGLLTLICLYKLFLERFLMASLRYREQSKAFGEKEWTLTVTFSADEITVEEGSETRTYPYRDIRSIRENDTTVWLYFGKRSILRLYKDSFLNGDWETCRALLTAKTENDREESPRSEEIPSEAEIPSETKTRPKTNEKEEA